MGKPVLPSSHPGADRVGVRGRMERVQGPLSFQIPGLLGFGRGHLGEVQTRVAQKGAAGCPGSACCADTPPSRADLGSARAGHAKARGLQHVR